MPSLTELSAASSVAAADQLVVNQSGTDKRADAGKLAILALANTFAALTTFAAGLVIGNGHKLFRPTAGVLRQQLEQFSLAGGALLTLSTDNVGRGLVYLHNRSDGKSALIMVDGAAGILIHGDSTRFSGAVGTADRLNVYAYDSGGGVFGVYVQNGWASTAKVVSAYVIG